MNIAVIGCGNMGAALARRLAQSHRLFLYDRNKEKALLLEKDKAGKACGQVEEAIASSEVVILAVKPQGFQTAAAAMRGHLKPNQTVVSVLSGTTLETLKQQLPGAHIVRMMPNLAVLHGAGAIGLCCDESTRAAVGDKLQKGMETLGKLYWLPESKFDALTALTGSGPAFFFTILEAMVDAGIAMGLSSPEARDMAAQMVQGSLALLQESGKHPGEIKWQITSPAGTTIAGLRRGEECGLRHAVIETFVAAYERARTLA